MFLCLVNASLNTSLWIRYLRQVLWTVASILYFDIMMYGLAVRELAFIYHFIFSGEFTFSLLLSVLPLTLVFIVITEIKGPYAIFQTIFISS
jgi:hypothetical protein